MRDKKGVKTPAASQHRIQDVMNISTTKPESKKTNSKKGKKVKIDNKKKGRDSCHTLLADSERDRRSIL